MRFSTLGNTGLTVSVLGFGCMRLPEKDGEVVRDLSTPLLRRAVELGINYFDTAIGYCHGDSQAAVGEALEGLRDKVILSTKNHHHSAGKAEWRRYLEESLTLLRTDYIDIYNHHGISWETFEKYLDPEKGGLTNEMIRAKEEGLIRHIAFSFHDTPENLIRLIDTGCYESVTLQFNLLDQRNKEAMVYAHEKGMGVVVMGPVGGGRLGLPSETISDLIGNEVGSTPEAALRFVWGTPGVNVALSGMQDREMLEENVEVAETCEPFTEETIIKLNDMVADRKKKSGLYCTGCGYCTPECPNGIAIPENLDLLNMAAIYDLHDSARQRYQWLKGKASECLNCGKCVVKCPQHIDIPKQLQKAAMLFDERAGTLQFDTVVDELDPEGNFGIKLKVFNFNEKTRDVNIRLTPLNGIVMKPDVLEIYDMPPFSRLVRKIDGSFPPGVSAIAFSVDAAGGETFTIEKNCRFMFVPKGTPGGWTSGTWVEFGPALEDFSEAGDTVGLHAVRFNLIYNDTHLILSAEVKDDFLYPTVRKGHDDTLGDCLEMLLDGREHADVGKPAFTEGVYRILLYPGTPGKAPPFYKAPRTDMGIKLKAESTDSGYRLRAFVPLKSFCLEKTPPKKIGFDLSCYTADREGVRIGKYTWAGSGRDGQDASSFREVWFV